MPAGGCSDGCAHAVLLMAVEGEVAGGRGLAAAVLVLVPLLLDRPRL